MMTSIGRRQFFKSAMVGSALLSIPASAGTIVFVPGTGIGTGSAPPSALLSRAKAALDQHHSRVLKHNALAIADFSKPSREPRFYLVDLENGRSTSFLVAHGKGSDPEHSGWVQSFSNTPGSEATSSGSYLVGETYTGQYGKSRRLAGLDPQNDQAENRAIVIHPAWYVNEALVHEQGKIGRSQGCFAFARTDIGQILQQVAPGTLLYADKL